MKKLFLLPIFLISLFLTTACNKNDDDSLNLESDRLIFGTFAGECFGNCVVLYKIEGGAIYEDDIISIVQFDSIKFKDAPMSAEKYDIAKVLVDDFPDKLKSEEEFIGCPDCADQGGYYIEIEQNGASQKWRIDTNPAELPEYLQDYTAQVSNILQQLL